MSVEHIAGHRQDRLTATTRIRVIEEKGRSKKSYVATVGRVIEFARLPEMPRTLELALDEALQTLARDGGDDCHYFAVREA